MKKVFMGLTLDQCLDLVKAFDIIQSLDKEDYYSISIKRLCDEHYEFKVSTEN